MIARLYVMFDRVAQESGTIFEARNDGTALREYNIFLARNAEKGVYEGDFWLLYLGEIDHDSSIIRALDEPVQVLANVKAGDGVEV